MLLLFASQHHTVSHSSQLQLGTALEELRGEQTGEAILPSKEVAPTSTLYCTDQLHGVTGWAPRWYGALSRESCGLGCALAECYTERGNDVGLLPRGWKGLG